MRSAQENVEALKTGIDNLARHIENVQSFGVPAVVAINRFTADTDDEMAALRQACAELGVEAIECTHWADGSKGTEKLAKAVVKLAEADTSGFRFLYPDEMPLWEKVRTIAQRIYGAQGIIADKKIRDQFAELQKAGYGHYPICMAKTQYSFSTDPNLKRAPSQPRRADPRDQAVGRRRVPGRHLRRDHDHARPAARARRPTTSSSTRTARSKGCSEALDAPHASRLAAARRAPQHEGDSRCPSS